MEGYRSGHNGAVLKTVRVKAHAGSNPAPSAMINAEFVYRDNPAFIAFVEQESLFFLLISTSFRGLQYEDSSSAYRNSYASVLFYSHHRKTQQKDPM